MSLRYRTAIATVISVMLIMAMLVLAYRLIVFEAYRGLEHDEALEELDRTVSVLRAEQHALDVLLTDWAQWDDMYAFVQSPALPFISSNLPDDILAQLRLNALVIRGMDGANVIGLARDGEARRVAIGGLTDAIASDSPLVQPNAEGHVTGILQTELGPMVISARPVLPSDGMGEPRGTVVMARLLDEAYTERLAEMLNIGVHVYPLASPAVPEAIRDGLAAGPRDTRLTGDGPDGHLAAYRTLYDLHDRPVLVLRTDKARTIEAQSGQTLLALLTAVGLTGLVLVVLLVAVINVTVVGRLRRLRQEMSSITGRGSSEGLRTHVSGRDEIGDVASGVNAMLDRLEAAAAERVRLEQTVSEQERLAEEAFRGLDEGLLVVDGEGRCTALNPAALRMLGLVQDEVIGRPLTAVLPVLRPADDVTRSAGEQYFEIGDRTIAVSRSDGEAARRLSVVALRDVTDVRAVERLKRDLVATVSHELRTPLTAIQATVSMLSEGDGGRLTDLQQRLVGILDRNTERLRVLIDDLLDMGALQGGRVALQRTEVDLAEVCAGVIEEVRAAAEQASIAVRADLEEATVSVDAARIRQVVENLLQNAVKFTPPGGSVEVSTRLAGGRATIVVRDTGIGIAPAELEHVFEKFYRTTNGARFAQGTGLGLSIAQSIVALHGGELVAESDGRNGTTMRVELPVDAPSGQAPSER